MPRRNRHPRPLWRLVLLALAAWVVSRLARGRPAVGGAAAVASLPSEDHRPRASRSAGARRLAASFAFATLLFAGASVTAVAGDQMARMLESESAPCGDAPIDPAIVEEPATTCEDEIETAAPPAEEEPADENADEPPVVSESPAAEPVVDVPADPAAEDPLAQADPAAAEPTAELDDTAPAEGAAVGDDLAPAGTEVSAAETSRPARPSSSKPLARRRPTAVERATTELDPEAGDPTSVATIWLHRALPDPTPPSARLDPEPARRLAATSQKHGVPWSLVLGVLRADGARNRVAPRRAAITATAERLAALGVEVAAWRRALAARAREEPAERVVTGAWNAALAITGRTTDADRALALAHYYRAVGLRALVRGLRAEQEALAERLLGDDRVELYAGGRVDVAAGRVDVRVLALVAYLADTFGQVTVSSLASGHGIYSRPGVVSAHVYGHAVDIAGLGEMAIAGNQEPGGLTEKAVRSVLLLPEEMLPRQVISLLGLGGPSFPLADHGDHVHVGF